MIDTEEQLDEATWPARWRPAQPVMDLLNRRPICPKCLSRTTKRYIEDWRMCPRCMRVWYRLTLEEAVELVPQAAIDRILELSKQVMSKNGLRIAWEKIAAELKKEKRFQLGEDPVAREWDWHLVMTVYERCQSKKKLAKEKARAMVAARRAKRQ